MISRFTSCVTRPGLPSFRQPSLLPLKYDEQNESNEQQIVILTRWHELLIPAYKRCSNVGTYKDTAVSRHERVDIAVRSGK